MSEAKCACGATQRHTPGDGQWFPLCRDCGEPCWYYKHYPCEDEHVFHDKRFDDKPAPEGAAVLTREALEVAIEEAADWFEPMESPGWARLMAHDAALREQYRLAHIDSMQNEARANDAVDERDKGLAVIAALRAEVERLTTALRLSETKLLNTGGDVMLMAARADKAEAEVERLKRLVVMGNFDDDATIRTLKTRVARLTAAIKDAEHDTDSCGSWAGEPCDCWKSRAIEEGK